MQHACTITAPQRILWPQRLRRAPLFRPAQPWRALHCSIVCDAAAGGDKAAAAPASGSGSPAAPLPPMPAAAPSALDGLPAQKLKQLQRDGLKLKDKIKVGRLGASEGVAAQVRRRWNTSEVARLYCHGKHAANMKLLAAQLEAITGGTVVFRAGGTVLLYRGHGWQPPAQPDPQQPEGEQQQAGEQQQQQQELAAAGAPAAESDSP